MISTEGTETLATVRVGTGQILEAGPALPVSGRVVRVAAADDLLGLGREAARGLDAVQRAARWAAEQGITLSIVDAWMAADQSRLTLVLDQLPAQPEALRLDLTRLFGLSIELFVRSPDGSMAITGPAGVGLPDSWLDWPAPPGADADVRQESGPADVPNARGLIHRLFPGR